MIRLAYLVSRYPAVSHTFILREVQALNSQGFDIQVASINAPDRPPEQMTQPEQAEVNRSFYVKPAGLLGALQAHSITLFSRPLAYFKSLWFALRLGGSDVKKILYGGFYFIEAIMIGRWMQRQHLQHIHVHFATPAATVAMILKKAFNFNYSITVHGPDEFYNVDAHYLRQKIIHAHFICCISQFARSQLMSLSPPDHWHKFEISPLGVYPDIFTPRPFTSYAQRPFEILCVGRLVPVKGQFILLQAATKLIHEGYNLRLRFVGDGPDRQTLEKSVKDQALSELIIFTGAVNQDQIFTYYRSADVFVLASFAEGVPVVLMEAMAMEIPCITTHITGIPELIHSEEGLLVPPSDVEALTTAIRTLITDENLAQRLGKQGRKAVLERYHLGKNIDRLAKIFQQRLQN